VASRDHEPCAGEESRGLARESGVSHRCQSLGDRVARSLSGLSACLLFDGHQRCSKRRVVWGEGKRWSVGRSEVGRLVIVGEDRLPKFVNKVGESVGE